MFVLSIFCVFRSAELAFSIPSFTSSENLPKTDYYDPQFVKDFDKYTLGKTFFDLKEFDRASFFLEDCTSHKAYFLYMYSRYLVSKARWLHESNQDFVNSFMSRWLGTQ